MRDYRSNSVGEQILNGIFVTLWLISRPFVWAYLLIHWFVVAVAKEAGNKVVKIVGGALALVVLGFLAQHFLH